MKRLLTQYPFQIAIVGMVFIFLNISLGWSSTLLQPINTSALFVVTSALLAWRIVEEDPLSEKEYDVEEKQYFWLKISLNGVIWILITVVGFLSTRVLAIKYPSSWWVLFPLITVLLYLIIGIETIASSKLPPLPDISRGTIFWVSVEIMLVVLLYYLFGSSINRHFSSRISGALQQKIIKFVFLYIVAKVMSGLYQRLGSTLWYSSDRARSREDYQMALQRLRQVNRFFPFHRTTLVELNRLVILYEAGLFTQALQSADKIIKSKADGSKRMLAVTLGIRSSVFLKMGERQEAINDLYEAIELDPNGVGGSVAREALNELGVLNEDHR